VFEDSPAARAGLKVGDIIQAIDDTSLGFVGDEEIPLREGLKQAGRVARLTVRLAGPERKIVKLNVRLNK
jgi:C-terminal processing protease CtpA/Prc